MCYIILQQILEKGELQVAGKERESQLSNQFRDIATIVMQKTINPETHRPYTISMIERLMHEIHFAVDPHNSSKKQVFWFVLLHIDEQLSSAFPYKWLSIDEHEEEPYIFFHLIISCLLNL